MEQQFRALQRKGVELVLVLVLYADCDFPGLRLAAASGL